MTYKIGPGGLLVEDVPAANAAAPPPTTPLPPPDAADGPADPPFWAAEQCDLYPGDDE